jgi:hypothetical protein
MTNRLSRIPLLAGAALLAALALAACGGQEYPTAHGEGEGAYIQAGPLVYQVQMSRELNPDSDEDREYLDGLAPEDTTLAGDEEWFGVWLRVENPEDDPAPSAEELKIVDTIGTEYEPFELPESNVFSYQPRELEGRSLLPHPDSAAGSGPIQGSLVLFKLTTAVYANRPLELEIVPPDGGEPSTVELDL